MIRYSKFIVFLFLLALNISAFGQSLPVTPFSLDNDLKVLQLSGQINLDHSMTIRPLRFSKQFLPDSFYKKLFPQNSSSIREFRKNFLGKGAKISLLPLNVITKYASHHPYGWSDASIKNAKGFQSVSSLGVFASLGPIEIQLSPEFLYASNQPYERNQYYGERNPEKRLKRFYPGQSRVDLNINAFSLGLSSENVWWGSGQFTSLMMTNNAPGFIHANFQTRRPVKTVVGNFEIQVIAGILNANDSLSEDVYDGFSLSDLTGFVTRNGDYRKYINGLIFNYSPKFIKGLNLGFGRTYVSPNFERLKFVRNKVGLVRTYLPIFDILFKQKRLDGSEDSLQWNQIVSFHWRYVFSKEKMEIYGEYGWNDHKANIRDLIMSTSHSSAYLIGLKKIIDLKNDKKLDLVLEFNNMSPSADDLVRSAGSWYIHGFYAHFSNYGEILGSGTGFGSNVLTFSANFRKKINQVGFRYEKVNRFPYRRPDSWIDHGFTFNLRKNINRMLIHLELTGVHSNNYAWMNNRDRFNVVGMCGLSYYW